MTNRRSRVARIACQRLSSQQAENRQNRQCQTSIPRKRACQNHALLEIVQGETPVDVHATSSYRARAFGVGSRTGKVSALNSCARINWVGS